MAKNPSTSPALSKPGSGTPSLTAENTSMHVLRKLGQEPKFNAGGKKTPA